MPLRVRLNQRLHVTTLCLLFTFSICSLADDAGAKGAPPGAPAGWRVGLGFAPVLSPVFEGAEEYGFSIFPDIRFQYRDRFFASVPEGVRYRVINGPNFTAGPIARLRFGREENDGGSPFLVAGPVDGLDGLGDVDAAAELGGFVGYRYEAWRARAEIRRGVGGHEGIVGDLSLNYSGGNRGFRFALGPRLRFGSSGFVDPYFGIDAVQARESGLPTFSADGGLNSVGFGANIIVPQGPRRTLVFFGGYDRLLGDIADSPLVEQRGSANQVAVGASLSWQFDFGGAGARR